MTGHILQSLGVKPRPFPQICNLEIATEVASALALSIARPFWAMARFLPHRRSLFAATRTNNMVARVARTPNSRPGDADAVLPQLPIPHKVVCGGVQP